MIPPRDRTHEGITPERLTTGLCGHGESGVKLQYKLAKTRRVDIARMHDELTILSVIGRYDILQFCR